MNSAFALDVAFLRASGAFDTEWYLRQYPDVASLGMDPVEHYVRYGVMLQRRPAPGFDTAYYLTKYKDVARAGINPFVHYLKYGSSEGRVTVRPYIASPAKTPALSTSTSATPSPGLNGSPPAPSGTLQRKRASWSWDIEATFKDALRRIQAANPGYFERTSASIVMPTRDRAATAAAAIRSVLGQSFRNWELLIVDDGSTDDTASVVQAFLNDPRIRYIAVAPRGVAAARNLGLQTATGDLVFYLDSDNTWNEDFLKLMVTFMGIGELEAAYCGSQMIGDAGQVNGYRGADFDWLGCYQQNYVDMNCFGHRRSAALKHRFDQSLRRLVDWDFILRLTAEQRTAFAPFCGVVYYDGARGARISLTEYQTAELQAVEDRIRKKHDLARLERYARRDLRPLWPDIIGAAGVLNDEYSSRLLEIGESLIDWQALRLRECKPGLISIVVLCYNNAPMTKACIESLLREAGGKYPIEVIAVDNASTDDTARMLAGLAASDPRVRNVASPTNLMFSLGNNLGVANACGEYAVLLNNDTLATPGWLQPLIDSLRLDPTVGLVGPKLLFPDGTLQCGGLVFSEKSKIPYHLYKGLDRAETCVNKARTFQALTGACLAFRVSDFVQLRGLDPLFINGSEDLDLCFRLRARLGKRALYNPRSEIIHLESKSEGRGRFIARNREKFVQRWGAAVRPDDASFHEEDGVVADRYVKPGTEADGPAALYMPVLAPRRPPGSAIAPVRSGPYNIGFSTMWYERGISYHAKQLADSLEGESFRTHIFARWESDRFSNAGSIHHPRVFNAGDDPSPDDLAQWVQEHRIDAMIFMEVHPKDWKRVKALKQLGVQLICYENLDVMRHENRMDYAVFDMFLFNAFRAREVFLSLFPHARVLMLPWGVRAAAAGSESQVDGPLRFVHVAGWGGLNNRKNTDLLIRAFARTDLSPAELHVFTQTPIAQYGDEIVALVAGSPNIVVHEGTLDDISAAYRDKAMLLWPSKREGLGLPILEALGHGLPVLISDGYMMKQWVIPGEHCVICPARPAAGEMLLPEMEVDEGRLAAALAALAANPDEVRRMRSCVARDRAAWEWSWQPPALRKELKRCLENRAHRPADDLSYVPPEVLEFEHRRRLACG